MEGIAQNLAFVRSFGKLNGVISCSKVKKVFKRLKKYELKEEDLIQEKNNRFYINKELFGAVLFSSSVKAGFAAVAEDSIEKRIDFVNYFMVL